ncbi:hypothetical protein LFREDSHE_26780 [Shewanella baltica]
MVLGRVTCGLDSAKGLAFSAWLAPLNVGGTGVASAIASDAFAASVPATFELTGVAVFVPLNKGADDIAAGVAENV